MEPPVLCSKEERRSAVLVQQVRIGFGLEEPLEKASICCLGGDVDGCHLVLIGRVQAGLMPNTGTLAVAFSEVLFTATGNMPKPV